MCDDGDPLLARVRKICLALPQAQEKISHGRPAFFTRKVFASYGGSVKTAAGMRPLPHSLLFLPDPSERAAIVADPRVAVPAYLGPSGWLALDLDRSHEPDWTEVQELIVDSYRATAPARLVSLLSVTLYPLGVSSDPEALP